MGRTLATGSRRLLLTATLGCALTAACDSILGLDQNFHEIDCFPTGSCVDSATDASNDATQSETSDVSAPSSDASLDATEGSADGIAADVTRDASIPETSAEGSESGADGESGASGDVWSDGRDVVAPDAQTDGGDGTVDSSASDSGAEEAEAAACSLSELTCDGGCVPNDVNNCGACGNACTGGTPLCRNSGGVFACTSGCDAGAVLCSSACTNTASDANNCGSCGHSCLGGMCNAGQCQSFVLTQSGGTSLYVDSSTVYLSYANSFGATVATVNKSNGNLGNSYAYAGTLVLAQDASFLYVCDTPFGGGATQVCIVSKSTMTATGPCMYQQTGANAVAIAVSGSSLWWLDSGHNLWGGTTANATATNPDMGAGSVLAADSAGLVWSEQSGTLTVAPVTLATTKALTGPAPLNPQSLVIDSTYAYWYNASDAGLYRSARDASGYRKLASPPNAPGQLAVDSTYVYWTDPTAGNVWRVAISGQSAAAILVPSHANVSGIAVDTVAVYWSMYNSTSNSGQLLALAK